MDDKETKYAEILSTVKDIDKDVDCIRDEMYERNKMGDGMNSFLAGLMSGKDNGLGAAELMAMCNQNGLGGNGIWLLIVLFALFGGGFGGGFNRFGGNGGAVAAADLTGQLISQGQNFTQRDVEQLATMIGCKSDQLSAALCNINNNITKVSGDIGLSASQIINAVQAGDASIISTLNKCCCDNQLAMCQQTNTLMNALTNGFANIGFNQQTNTSAIVQAIKDEGSLTRAQEAAHYTQAQIDARDARIAQLEREKLETQISALQAAVAKIPTTTTTTAS